MFADTLVHVPLKPGLIIAPLQPVQVKQQPAVTLPPRCRHPETLEFAVGLAAHDPSCGWAKRHNNSDDSLKCTKAALSQAAGRQTNHSEGKLRCQQAINQNNLEASLRIQY